MFKVVVNVYKKNRILKGSFYILKIFRLKEQKLLSNTDSTN